jgi:peroxiredoxin
LRRPCVPVGTPAPQFDLPNLDEKQISLDTLLGPKKPVLLMFTHPGCDPCKSLLPQISRWQHDFAVARLTIIGGSDHRL